MTVSVPFGPVITAGDIRGGLKTVLTASLPSVITAVCNQKSISPSLVPPPAAWGGPTDPSALPAGTSVPLGVISAPGTTRDPVKRGNGDYELQWDAGVGLISSHPDSETGQRLSEIYGAAIRACILQNGSLGGVADSVRWVDESNEETAWNSGQSVWAATVIFAVTCVAVVDGYATAGPDPAIVQHIQIVGRLT